MSELERIKQILDEWDPVGLVSMFPDEYLPIADELFEILQPKHKVEWVLRKLKQSFQIYGVDFNRPNAECRQVARKILEVITQ